MKVFFQAHNATVGQHDNAKSKAAPPPPPPPLEEVYLPLYIYQELRKGLRESNQSLPTSIRKYQDWDIGLLERFITGV
jgi:HECT-like Ubiquitin-conjugating enzyme (E2)-binding